MKTISAPQGRKRQLYAQKQEVRKDVERCFGVLQLRFGVICNPGRLWDLEMLRVVWTAAVIMHNMIIEDEAPFPELNQRYLQEEVTHERLPNVQRAEQVPLTFKRFMHAIVSIRDKQQHYQLRDDLIENLWLKHGEE
jgi:hypothetical protein